MFIYFERERDRKRERERGGEHAHVHEWGRSRERRREGIPSRLRAVSIEPHTGLHLTDHEIVTRAEIKSQGLIRLSHPGAPVKLFLSSISKYRKLSL